MSTPDRFWFLFGAYAAIWSLLALFLLRLGRRQCALSRELDELRARLGKTPAGGERGRASSE